MTQTPNDHTKFVVAGSVALFESWVNGRMRVWEHPIRKPIKLTETRDPYIAPRAPYATFRI